jgi:hypothetical protein
MRLYQVPRSQTLRMARSACGNSTDNQAVAVFHQRMSHEGNRCLDPTLRLGLLMLRSAPLK